MPGPSSAHRGHAGVEGGHDLDLTLARRRLHQAHDRLERRPGSTERRSAVEPIIGHLKAVGHLGRCYLKGRAGDAANVVLSAVGHNFRRVLAWLRELLCLFLFPLWRALAIPAPLNWDS